MTRKDLYFSVAAIALSAFLGVPAMPAHAQQPSAQTVAIIAIGVILQGETNHAENLSRSVTDALQRIAVTHGIPVINVVLSFDNEEQARARCLEDEINRGTEAARAAIGIANLMLELRGRGAVV